MSGSSPNLSPPRSWKEILSTLSQYSGIIQLILWGIAGLSWIVGVVPAALVLILTGIAITFTGIAIVGHVFVSGGEPLTTLPNLVPNQLPVAEKKKIVPKSNLSLLGIEHVNLYADENDEYWEMRRGKSRQEQPSYSAVLRFGNEPIPGQPGQRIRNLRAKLTYRDVETGQVYPPIDRALWVREKYNSINLEVGDSRLLLIGFGLPYGYVNPGFTFVVANNYYIGRDNGDLILHKIDSRRLEVFVRLVAGDAGLILYEGTFELDTSPQLVLSEKS